MATIIGTNGNDARNGTPEDDVVDLLAGQDTLTLTSGGRDRVDLGAGDDVVIVNGTTLLGADTVNLGEGVRDRVRFVGDGVNIGAVLQLDLALVGNGAVNAVRVSAEAGGAPTGEVSTYDDEGVTFAAETGYRFTVLGAGGAVIARDVGLVALADAAGGQINGFGALPSVLIGGAGGDRLIAEGSYLFGGAGNDQLIGEGPLSEGGDGNDQLLGVRGTLFQGVFRGGAGDDTILGGDFDILDGGDGVDTLSAFNSSVLEGGAGNDVLATSFNNNILNGGAGDDILDGRGVANTLAGGDGNDRILGGQSSLLQGGAGDDILRVGFGTATLQGGDGRDNLFSTGGVLDGGAGDDLIRARGTLIGGVGADTLDVSPLLNGVGEATIVYNSVSDSTPAAFDTIIGFDTGLSRLDLTAINADAISLVRQGSGTFLFASTAQGPMKIAFTGEVNLRDLLLPASAPVTTLLGNNAGSPVLVGSARADTIIGDERVNIITGGGGADVLVGGAGTDFFSVGPGDSNADAPDILPDFVSGVDFLSFSDLSITQLSIVRSNGVSYLFADSTRGRIALIAADLSPADLNHAGPAFLLGSDDADRLTGAGGDDTIVGGGGADRLRGGLGADRQQGGAGADTFVFAASDSTVARPDTILDFTSGQDVLDLTALPSAGGALRLTVEAGRTVITRDAGDFWLSLEAPITGADLLLPDARGLFITGDFGRNTLTGSARDDVIQGGAGDDVITGGGTGDSLVGGAGQDTFVYRAASDSPLGGFGDYIFDFERGVDRIDLRPLGVARSSLGLVVVDPRTAILFVDTTGDGVGDMAVTVFTTGLVSNGLPMDVLLV